MKTTKRKTRTALVERSGSSTLGKAALVSTLPRAHAHHGGPTRRAAHRHHHGHQGQEEHCSYLGRRGTPRQGQLAEAKVIHGIRFERWAGANRLTVAIGN